MSQSIDKMKKLILQLTKSKTVSCRLQVKLNTFKKKCSISQFFFQTNAE